MYVSQHDLSKTELARCTVDAGTHVVHMMMLKETDHQQDFIRRRNADHTVYVSRLKHEPWELEVAGIYRFQVAFHNGIHNFRHKVDADRHAAYLLAECGGTRIVSHVK